MDDSGVPCSGNLQKFHGDSEKYGEMTEFVDEFPSYKANMALETWMLNMMKNMRYLWDTMICYSLRIYPVMENVYPPVVKHGNGNVLIYRCFSQLLYLSGIWNFDHWMVSYKVIHGSWSKFMKIREKLVKLESTVRDLFKVVPQFGIAEEHNSNFTRTSGRSIGTKSY